MLAVCGYLCIVNTKFRGVFRRSLTLYGSLYESQVLPLRMPTTHITFMCRSESISWVLEKFDFIVYKFFRDY